MRRLTEKQATFCQQIAMWKNKIIKIVCFLSKLFFLFWSILSNHSN